MDTEKPSSTQTESQMKAPPPSMDRMMERMDDDIVECLVNAESERKTKLNKTDRMEKRIQNWIK